MVSFEVSVIVPKECGAEGQEDYCVDGQRYGCKVPIPSEVAVWVHADAVNGWRLPEDLLAWHPLRLSKQLCPEAVG